MSAIMIPHPGQVDDSGFARASNILMPGNIVTFVTNQCKTAVSNRLLDLPVALEKHGRIVIAATP